jgi:hypothetical protein
MQKQTEWCRRTAPRPFGPISLAPMREVVQLRICMVLFRANRFLLTFARYDWMAARGAFRYNAAGWWAAAAEPYAALSPQFATAKRDEHFCNLIALGS